MFYRVACWTNGLIIDPAIGRSYSYTLTNAHGEGWWDEIAFHGRAHLPSLSNNYTVATGTFSWDGDIMPSGVHLHTIESTWFVRITEDTLYLADPAHPPELPFWKLAEPGTTWTNNPHEITTIESYEDISVPAGTFTDCIRLHRRFIGSTDMDTGVRQWIKPGFMLIKEIDYPDYLDPPEAGPIEKQLYSWSEE